MLINPKCNETTELFTWVKIAAHGIGFPFHWQDLSIPFSPSFVEVIPATSNQGIVEYHNIENIDL
jgi:hypothetical protein